MLGLKSKYSIAYSKGVSLAICNKNINVKWKKNVVFTCATDQIARIEAENGFTDSYLFFDQICRKKSFLYNL